MQWSFLPALFAATLIIMLLSFRAGWKLGRWKSQQPNPEPQLSSRMIVSSILALLAFMMSFEFGLASSNSNSRNAALRDEAIAIGTAYRRADLLPEPARTNVRDSLVEYVDLRIEGTRSENIDETIARIRQMQKRMWAQAIAGGSNGGPAPPTLLIQSLNEVIDIHGERVLNNIRSRVPIGVWSVLYAISILAIAAAGYHHGLCGGRKSIAAIAYALIFALVIAMIADLDAPRLGVFKVSQQALIDLRGRLIPPLP